MVLNSNTRTILLHCYVVRGYAFDWDLDPPPKTNLKQHYIHVLAFPFISHVVLDLTKPQWAYGIDSKLSYKKTRYSHSGNSTLYLCKYDITPNLEF